MDAAVTYLIVERVVDRQEERKRRSLSGVVEARLLDLTDGLLTDALPSSARRLDHRVVAVGVQEVSIQLEYVDLQELDALDPNGQRLYLGSLRSALDRYAEDIDQPLFVNTIEPRLAPQLVALITGLRTCRARSEELRRYGDDSILQEVLSTARNMFQSAADLHRGIVERWS
jgi:hypothetical protein